MKKLTLLIAASMFLGNALTAKPVSPGTAQTVAQNFYSQTYHVAANSVTLAYTEKDASGKEVYYAFNIANGGFVIISAEDAGHPVIGYSNEGKYIAPKAGTNLDYWMGKRKKEIISMRSQKLVPTAQIAQEWVSYINNTPVTNKNKFHKALGGTYPSSTVYLVQSKWDQSPYYNADCPGGSVTGCVATAMSQIMRYWSYPNKGRGSSSYCDCTASGFSQNYGTLSANYGNTIYNWTNMPLSVKSANADVATLMYDAGVSVDMDYAPSGSGAYVISADDSICAQNSYVQYFGYEPTTIYGFYDSTISSTSLIDTLQNEINNGRPVEYAGYDSSAGGHTWVCDGYDSLNNFHMNWGWSGQDNGWYALNNLNPGGAGGYNFKFYDECLIGIEPRQLLANFGANPVYGCSSLTATFTDQSYTTGTITGYSWRFPGGTPSTSTAANPTVTYNTPGTYSATEIVTSTNGIDSITQTALITVSAPIPLPFAQDFESGVFPPKGWTINNPNNHATTWQPFAVGGFGQSANCMYYNNCLSGVIGERDQIYSPPIDYSTDASPFIFFDVAYEPYGVYQKVDYSDTLAVYYSLDCGATWTNVYLKGGAQLSTTGGTAETGTDTAGGAGCFMPTNTTWRTDTILLPAIANQSNVMFSFENRSGYGGNLYVDDINIHVSNPAGIKNITAPPASVSVFPNPNDGSFTIELSNTTSKQQLTVYNALGQSIYSSVLNSSKTQINLDQPAGVYFYRVLSLNGKTLSEGKLVIK